MNGILLVNKPKGYSSLDCIKKLKQNIDGSNKIGHLGNLDPFATGVLPILINKATKLFKVLTRGRKVFITEMELGKKSDTNDAKGNIVYKDDDFILGSSDIKKAFDFFNDGYLQELPDHIQEEKMQKDDVDEKDLSNFVKIYNLKLLNIENNSVIFMIEVGSKFYIRKFITDIAEYLNTNAYLKSLKRTQYGKFSLTDAIELDDISGSKDIKKNLISINKATDHLHTIKVNRSIANKVLNGGKISLNVFDKMEGHVRILNRNENVLAIGEVYNGHFNYVSVLGEVL